MKFLKTLVAILVVAAFTLGAPLALSADQPQGAPEKKEHKHFWHRKHRKERKEHKHHWRRHQQQEGNRPQ